MKEDLEQQSQRSLEDVLKQTREDLNKHKEACDKAIITPAEKKETTDSIKNFVAMLSSSDFAKKHETAINKLRGSKESDDNKTLSEHIDASTKLLDLYVKKLEYLKRKEFDYATKDADSKTKKLKKSVKKAGQSVNEERTKAEQAVKKEAEEGKKTIIQEAIKKSDTTRVGKYLVTPYLQSKYIRGEKQSQRYDRAMTGVIAWIGLDGLSARLQAHQEALDKKLADLKKKFNPEGDTSEEKNEDGIVKKKKSKIDEIKEKLHDKKTIEERKGHLRSQCEKLTGKKIDHVKFDEFISKWLESHKQERQQLIDHYAKLRAESKDGISIYNPLMETGSRMALEAKAPFELFRALVSEGYISAGSIACEQVEIGGKTIIRYGMAFGGLVYNGLGAVFGQISVSDFSQFVQEKLDIKLNEHTRMLLRGIMYRHGGLFTNALATVGHAATAMTSYMLQNNTDDISKFNAWFKGGVMNNIDSQLKVINQLENKMANSGLFKDMPGVMDDARCKALGFKPGLTHLTAIIEQVRLNTIMVHLSKKHGDATGFLDAISKLDAPLNTEVLDNLKANVGGDLDTFKYSKKYREVLKGALGKNLSPTSGLMSEMTKKVGRIETIGKGLGLTHINKGIERDFIKKMSDYSKIQQSMVAGDSVLDTFSLKGILRGQKLGEILKLADQNVLYLKKPEDVAAYFDEINQVVKKFPEVAKTLLASLPILMVGKEVAESMNTATGITDAGAKILYGVGSLMPLVGPMMMLYHSADQQGEMKGDISGMVLGGIMLGRDGASIISQFSKGALSGGAVGASRAVLKGMLQPLHDLRNLATGTVKTLYVGGRVAIHGAELLRKDPKGFAKAAINFIKNIGVRAGIAGGIALGLAFVGKGIYDEIMNDATIDEYQKKLAKSLRDNPYKLEQELQKTRPTLTADQKAEITRFAIGKQCEISLDMLPAGGSSTATGAINIQVDPLGRNPSLLNKKASIEQHLSKLEGKPVSIHYYFENTDRCIDQYKNFLHKELFGEKDKRQPFDVTKVEQYMLAQGFTQGAIDQWKQPECKEPMATVFVR